jgi:hypothetical protein
MMHGRALNGNNIYLWYHAKSLREANAFYFVNHASRFWSQFALILYARYDENEKLQLGFRLGRPVV